MSKIVVIGAMASGLSAAFKVKRNDVNSKVVVYEMGAFASYGACGLPYYIGDDIRDISSLIARGEGDFKKAGIDVKLNHKVTKVYPEDKTVVVKELKTGRIFVDSYDKLLISTGASSVRPKIKGINFNNIFTLKTLEDGVFIKKFISSDKIKNVVVVGGGYIGIEMVEALKNLGKQVTVIEGSDRILGNFDLDISEKIREYLKTQNVDIKLKEVVEEFVGEESARYIKTNKGAYECDAVILSVGIKPNTEFLDNTGLRLAGNRAVEIDREMRTSVKDIYAAGDCATIYHRILEENVYIPLGTNSNKLGRIVGDNLLGGHKKYQGTLGTSAIKIFELEAARTGLSEKEAKNYALDYDTVFVKAASHAGYYPNSTPIFIKLIYEKGSKRLLGAQTLGIKGAVLRIDIFAAAIHNNMTTEDLGYLDLCYAPPFASVWDAVQVAANAVK